MKEGNYSKCMKNLHKYLFTNNLQFDDKITVYRIILHICNKKLEKMLKT